MAYTTLFAAPSRAERKMQRKIAERCIRYFTKVGLRPASTTTLPLLDIPQNSYSKLVALQKNICSTCDLKPVAPV